MTNHTDERLRQAGGDVRRSVAGLAEGRVPGRRRIGPALAFATAAAVVAAVVAVPLLLRAGDEEASPTVAATTGTPIAVGVSVTTADLGDVFAQVLAPGGDGVLLVGQRAGSNLPDPVVLTAAPDAAAWRTLTETVGPQHFGSMVSAGDVVLTLGAVDGTTTTAYRSADGGATWAEQPLPLPAGRTRVVVQRLATTADGGFVAAGIGTSSTFDESSGLLLWRSPDGAAWEVEEVLREDTNTRWVESITEVDGRLVVIAWAEPAAGGRELLAVEEGDEWQATELRSVLTSQAAIDVSLVNANFAGAGLVDGRLSLWWTFDNGLPVGEGRQDGAAVARRAGPGSWEAKPLTGTPPARVAVVDGGVVGLAYAGQGDYFPPADTLLVASNQGVAWSTVETYPGVFLADLLPVGPGRLVAAGVRTSLHPEGYTETGDGVAFGLELPEPFAALLGPETGG